MTNDPSITVIFPTYNHARYVPEALQSVFGQDYADARNVHIVVSDDCSSDDSFDVARAVAAGYVGPYKVTVRRNEKNLCTDHTNFLVQAFPSDIYVLCCDDDIQHPGRLARTVDAWRQGALVVTANARTIDGDGRVTGMKVAGNASLPAPTIEEFITKGVISTCFGAGLAFSRRLFDVFGPMPSHIRNADLLLPFRAALLSDTGNCFLQEPLLDWRRHQDMSTLGAKERVGDDAQAQAVDREKWFCNTVANWLNFLSEWQRIHAVHPRDPVEQGKIVERILNLTHHWTLFRSDMSRKGLGIA